LPFTLSHPSAALPFWPLIRRGFVPLAPFAIGAMAPDFEYLLRLEPWALLSHSARGVFVFCLPIGLATWILWVMLLHPVARALVALPPAPARLPRTTGGWMLVAVAIMLGSSTHVFWDALTHRDTWGPAVFPILNQTALTLGPYPVPWYNLLQLASSLIGGAVVLAWLRQEIVRRGDGIAALLAPWRVRAWLALGTVSLAVAIWNAPQQGMMTHVTRTKLVFGRLAVGALVGLAIGLVALAVLHRLGRFRITEDRTAPSGGTYAS